MHHIGHLFKPLLRLPLQLLFLNSSHKEEPPHLLQHPLCHHLDCHGKFHGKGSPIEISPFHLGIAQIALKRAVWGTFLDPPPKLTLPK